MRCILLMEQICQRCMLDNLPSVAAATFMQGVALALSASSGLATPALSKPACLLACLQHPDDTLAATVTS